MPQKNEKYKAVDLAINQIEKQFGKGAIMRWGSDQVVDVPVIPTGALSLDIALGVGGIPRGRVVEIYGPEGSGKTTLAQHIIAEAQNLGGVSAFIDAEHALDPAYAKSTGINLDELLISQPDTGEQALEIVECLVRSGGVDLVVIDSVAALVPRAEIDGDMGDPHVGIQARLMSHALRKLGPIVNKSKSCIVFTNQIRLKIGVMFGNPETTPGGLALKFHASVRMEIRRVSSIKVGQDVLGNTVRVKVVKNKVAPPFKEAEFDVMFGEGISKEGNLVDVAVNRKIIQKSGAWFNYNDERLGQGRENAKQFLKEHPDIATKIEQEIRSSLGVNQPNKGEVKLQKVEGEIDIPEEDDDSDNNDGQ